MKILNTDALTGSKFKKAAKKLDFENFKLQLPPTLPFLVKVTFLDQGFMQRCHHLKLLYDKQIINMGARR